MLVVLETTATVLIEYRCALSITFLGVCFSGGESAVDVLVSPLPIENAFPLREVANVQNGLWRYGIGKRERGSRHRKTDRHLTWFIESDVSECAIGQAETLKSRHSDSEPCVFDVTKGHGQQRRDETEHNGGEGVDRYGT